ncbi:MAG: PhnD/SsuA/transferrin family substrate-binding protein, partial [Proteobacteria bacterium]|nr:PhnD/SsuA/transferrin family substrate-binding protein [Pseudomonadota bacterium]
VIAALAAVVSTPTLIPSAQAQTMMMDAGGQIPDWVKPLALSWVNGDTSDSEFLDALQQLIATDILRLTNEVGVDELALALIPVKPADVGDFRPNADRFGEFLEEQLGIDVEITIPASYESIIEGIRFGHIDAAIMDTGPGWFAHTLANADVVMAEVDNGRIYYQATAWVGVDNDEIDSIDDVLGKKVSFTSQTGSSGFIQPFGTLVSEGHVTIDGDDAIALQEAIDDAFASHAFPNSYGGAADLLARGQVDVAFGNDRLHTYLEDEDRGLIKPAFTIGPVPSHVLVVNSDMSENTRKALVDAMLKLNTDAYNEILVNLYQADAMLPTTTDLHLGSFGENLDVLPGYADRLLGR